jgi:hypothetical protein
MKLLAGILSLVVVAAVTYGHGVEEWHFKLADLHEDPLYLRGMPELTVIVGLVLSGLLYIGALVARRRAPAPIPARKGPRWHWWWLLIAGWGGYIAGSAVVIAGGPSTSYPTSLHAEFGAPLGSFVDVPATCRTAVGSPGLLAEVVPAVAGFPQLTLRSVVTGKGPTPGFGLAGASFTDGRGSGNDLQIPNVPARPAPYLQMASADGSTQAEPPISFVRAYYYQVIGLEERGLTGKADLLGVRFSDPFGSASMKWMNLEMPHDPWPAAIDVRLSWSCGTWPRRHRPRRRHRRRSLPRRQRGSPGPSRPEFGS